MNNQNIIYCDFDGTITKEDSVNKFLSLFADEKWLEVEERWVNGEIGSKQCLFEQVNLIPELPANILQNYIDSIEIDDYFIPFYNFLKKHNYELVILSDGFDLFIKETLKKHNLKNIKYFANTLTVKNNKLNISFNNGNPDCKNASGTCKCSKIEVENFYYIGDGLSDACVSKKAKKLFAKKNLKKYCDEQKIDYIDFETFEEILGYFARKGELNAKLNYINK